MSLKKNIIKNGIAATIQKIVKVAEQLLLVPFFISAWGAAYYGEWLTLTIIPTMLGFSDMGFGSAACNSFVLKYASGDVKGAADTSKSGFFAVNSIVLLISALSIAGVFILDYFGIFNKSLIDRSQAMWAVLMLMLARTIAFYVPLNEAYFRSSRKVSLSIGLQTLYAASNIVGGLIVLLLKGNIVVFAFVNLLISIIFNICYAFVAHSVLKFDSTIVAEIKKEEIRTIFRKGFGFLLSPVWQAIFFQGTTFVVRLVLGPVAVTVFNTVRTLTRSVNQANAMVITSVMPEIQFELGTGNIEKAKHLFYRSMMLMFGIAIIGMAFLYFLGPWFYSIWTHKSLNPPAAMWNIFICGIIFNSVWWLCSELLNAMNKPYSFTTYAVLLSSITVLLSYYFSKSSGLTGSAVGSFFLELFLFIISIWKVYPFEKVLKS